MVFFLNPVERIWVEQILVTQYMQISSSQGSCVVIIPEQDLWLSNDAAVYIDWTSAAWTIGLSVVTANCVSIL